MVRVPAVTEQRSVETLEFANPTAPLVRRILIVDDDADAAASMAKLLQLSGHETHTVHDGLQALQAAERLHPNVVLLDLGLPKLNGYEVCRRIRQQPWAKYAVIVAVTGSGQENDRQKSSEAGFDLHMVKPPDYAALMQLLWVHPPAREGARPGTA